MSALGVWSRSQNFVSDLKVEADTLRSKGKIGEAAGSGVRADPAFARRRLCPWLTWPRFYDAPSFL